MVGLPVRDSGREEATRLAASLSEAVRRLHLHVQAAADSLLSGDGMSRLGGGGVEVVGVREYQPGDEARGIDWRVTARRGRLHVKEFAEERDQPILLALDRSPTLRGGRNGIKEVRALEATALLAAVALRDGHRVGLLQRVGRQVQALPTGRGRQQLPLLLERLLSGREGSAGTGGILDLMAAACRMCRERTRVFLVGDFHLAPGDLPGMRSRLHPLLARHIVTPVRILDRLEGDFPPVGSLLLQDPATGTVTRVRTGARGREWRQALGEALAETGALFREAGMEEWRVEVQDPLLPQLQFLLSGVGRKRRGRA